MSIRDAFIANGYDAEFAFGAKADQSKHQGSGVSDSRSISTLKKILKRWKWFYYTLVFRRYFKKQQALLNQLKNGPTYDLIVEFHTVGSNVGLELSKSMGAKLSVIFDSPVDEQFLEMHGTKSFWWNRIKRTEKETMKAAENIMVYSPACEDHLRSKYLIQGTVTVLPSLLNKPSEVVRAPGENFVIGFIGSFLSWHKLDLMLNVFEKFHNKYKDSRLYLIGFGQEWHSIYEQVKAKKLVDKVHMPGFVTEDELTRLKGEFTIAVMPGSNWYGSPLKLFEYAQAAIPFVAPVSKTVSSVFEDEEHCFFVKEEDEFNSLFKALETYYLMPDQGESVGLKVQSFVKENFNQEKYASKLIEALTSQ